jgi:hypothetical protein
MVVGGVVTSGPQSDQAARPHRKPRTGAREIRRWMGCRGADVSYRTIYKDGQVCLPIHLTHYLPWRDSLWAGTELPLKTHRVNPREELHGQQICSNLRAQPACAKRGLLDYKEPNHLPTADAIPGARRYPRVDRRRQVGASQNRGITIRASVRESYGLLQQLIDGEGGGWARSAVAHLSPLSRPRRGCTGAMVERPMQTDAGGRCARRDRTQGCSRPAGTGA